MPLIIPGVEIIPTYGNALPCVTHALFVFLICYKYLNIISPLLLVRIDSYSNGALAVHFGMPTASCVVVFLCHMRLYV